MAQKQYLNSNLFQVNKLNKKCPDCGKILDEKGNGEFLKCQHCGTLFEPLSEDRKERLLKELGYRDENPLTKAWNLKGGNRDDEFKHRTETKFFIIGGLQVLSGIVLVFTFTPIGVIVGFIEICVGGYIAF